MNFSHATLWKDIDFMMKIRKMTVVGLMTAVLCILGPIAIVLPVSPVPVSLTNLVICLIVYILGAKKGTICCLLYLLMGMIGLPIFSGFTGGIGKLLGPTGGYLIGFIALAFVSGWFIEKWQSNRWMHGIGIIFGMLLCYSIGTCWLAIQSQITIKAAVITGILPFLLGDIVKVVLVLLTGPMLRYRLRKAGILL